MWSKRILRQRTAISGKTNSISSTNKHRVQTPAIYKRPPSGKQNQQIIYANMDIIESRTIAAANIQTDDNTQAKDQDSGCTATAKATEKALPYIFIVFPARLHFSLLFPCVAHCFPARRARPAPGGGTCVYTIKF